MVVIPLMAFTMPLSKETKPKRRHFSRKSSKVFYLAGFKQFPQCQAAYFIFLTQNFNPLCFIKRCYSENQKLHCDFLNDMIN